MLNPNWLFVGFAGCAKLVDLVSFWTGGNSIGFNDESLLAKFDADFELPMAETCFMGLTLPTKYNSYEEFKKQMDIAISYGGKGFDFS